jgi:diguanylate cyclase (GGDEF)-like protein
MADRTGDGDPGGPHNGIGLSMDNFAFLLPFMMIAFGCAFLAITRLGGRQAWLWGIGFLCAGTAFAVQEPINPSTNPLFTALGDGLTAIAFLLFGEALIQRAGIQWALPFRIVLCGTIIVAGGIAIVHFGSVAVEVLISDWGCMSLIALPLIKIHRRMTRPIDQALVWINTVIIVDNLSRSCMAFFVPAQSPLLLSDTYVFLWQATAAISGIVYALTALAAIILDVVAGYREQALRDPLSGLWNRRGFEQALPVDRTRTAAIVTCDIDLFKDINDGFGHGIGDQVIAALAATIVEIAPAEAVAARFGGEEFVICLPGRGAAEAIAIADAIRSGFLMRDWLALGLDRPVTVSFGVAEVQTADFSVHDAIARADRGLYDAKRAGRNRVALGHAGPPPATPLTLVRVDGKAPPQVA